MNAPLFPRRFPLLSSFFFLPGLELHYALGALLVEDPVPALAAADDVAGLELVLLACFWWVFGLFFFGGGGGGW